MPSHNVLVIILILPILLSQFTDYVASCFQQSRCTVTYLRFCSMGRFSFRVTTWSFVLTSCLFSGSPVIL